jgi:hypothetical protein
VNGGIPRLTRCFPTAENADPSQDTTRAPSHVSEPVFQFMPPTSPPADVNGDNGASYGQINPLYGAAPSTRPDYLKLDGMAMPQAEGSPGSQRIDFAQMDRLDGRLMMGSPSANSSLMGPQGVSMGMMNTAFYGGGLDGFEVHQGLEHLPMDVHDMLSGLTTY